jgi:hypothetical protein
MEWGYKATGNEAGAGRFDGVVDSRFLAAPKLLMLSKSPPCRHGLEGVQIGRAVDNQRAAIASGRSPPPRRWSSSIARARRRPAIAPSRCPAAQSGHLGGGPCLVDRDEASWTEVELARQSMDARTVLRMGGPSERPARRVQEGPDRPRQRREARLAQEVRDQFSRDSPDTDGASSAAANLACESALPPPQHAPTRRMDGPARRPWL